MYKRQDQRGKYVEVTKNIRGCWSSTVRARTQLDSAREKAGDHFQCLYERCTSGKVSAAWRVLVKKKSFSGSVPIRVLTAGRQLAEVQCRLGRSRFLLLELICGFGLTLSEAAQRYFGRTSSHEDEARLLELLLEALDELALHWGYAASDKCQPNGSGVGQPFTKLV